MTQVSLERSPAASSADVEAGGAKSSQDPAPTKFPQIEAILSAPEVKQTFGLVEGQDGSVFNVRCGTELVQARRAKGCLLEPVSGDTVLVARSEHHGAYVLSVLVGESEECSIAVDGDLTLRSKTGRIAVSGGSGVSVASGGEVAVNAPSVALRTMSATVFSDALSYVGTKLDAQVGQIQVLGHAIETVFDRLTSRVKHSFRTIDEIEHVKVKEMHVHAENTLNLHGKNALMTADKLVKLDGEQITIG